MTADAARTTFTIDRVLITGDSLEGTLHDTRATAHVPVPDVLSFGVGVRPVEPLFLQVQFDFVNWSRLESLRLTAQDNPQLDVTIPQNWKNGYTLPLSGVTFSGVLAADDSITVKVDKDSPTFFAKLFGIDTVPIKAEASADGGLEFVKEDVNRDGKTDLADCFIVDKFIGKDYRNLDDQLAATVTV